MILLTGASGFIGRHLLSALIHTYGKENVLALTSAPVEGCQYLLHNNYTFHPEYLTENKIAAQTDTIIHAGAFTPKTGNRANDWSACNSNIFSTHQLLSAGLPALKKVIYLSTLDVYGSDEIISENSPVQPLSLYGESKLYSEKMIAAWAEEVHKTYQILRVGHVYGPGEEAYQKIIPVTINKLLQNERPQIWGTGDEVRSFIYITDIVSAILEAIKLSENAGVINITGGNKITVNELVNKLVLLNGKNLHPERIQSGTKGRDLIFDNTKMKKLLLPEETPFDTGLFEEWQYMKKLKA